MAHRGRLNVLAHVLNKPYQQILAEFKDPARDRQFRDELGWTGDVKYHMGALRALKENDTVQLVIRMPPNPSHVETINPVIEGMARAAGTRVDEGGPPRFDTRVTLPILVHGDAAFPGQGVVAETFNLSRLAGYDTGGTIHIIANNQLGYTTDPQDTRSTLYASDLAKGFEIPILHVNVDDPEACLEAARTAFAFLSRFGKDFVIDLVGYRRFGHNESDEPSFTQPQMYSRIREHPPVYEIWGRKLETRNVIEAGAWKKQHAVTIKELQDELDSLEAEEALPVPDTRPASPQAAREVETAVPLDRLRELYDSFLALPKSFQPNPKIERARKKRSAALDDPEATTVTWPVAEDLAFASLLADGVAVRLTGEDTERGTFGQRHAVLHDYGTGERYIPLQSLPQAKAAFEIRNSPLTENAALGFELGYNIQEPQRLVLWEAQYGDFVNGAQVMIDELLVSARAKWGQSPSLVLLLPHGYEGHGPDHSSAYLERFLQLAAEDNLRIANCTTAAQYFHLLRLHARLLESDPLPLVVFAPKSLLRHPLASSTPWDLAEGGWRPVLDDDRMVADDERADQVRRLILCSGKVHVDLVSSEHYDQDDHVAIARIEQLYPFPGEEVMEIVGGYPHLEEVTWVQEEPENMGAWEFVRPVLHDLSEGEWPLRYVGRPRSASPAEGSTTQHRINQEALIRLAFQMEPKGARDSHVVLEDVSSGKEK
jgi:2-oxoglutarate dehydrogenase E1 component